MNNQLYCVTATLPLIEVSGYLAWLERHIDDVLRAGALDAKVIVYASTAESQDIETQYTFADPGAFHTYEQMHAPKLREEGRKLFGSKPGVAFTRRVGTIHCQRNTAG